MRIFFSSDLHGSDVCFRKFLNAREFYHADVLLLGGDLCAGSIVFAEQIDAGWQVRLAGRDLLLRDQSELEKFRSALANKGHLLKLQSHQDPGSPDQGSDREDLDHEIQAQLRRWVELAATKSPRHPVYFVPGNDDPYYLDDIFEFPPFINIHRKHILLDEETSIMGIGGSTPTPWKTEREYSEEQLEGFVTSTFNTKLDQKSLILLSHCPPHNSGLDLAPALLGDFSYELHLGMPRPVPVGSLAIREALRQLAPILGLFGHVHEGRGHTKIHQTLCINPGSAPWSGRLQGCLVDISEGKVASFQLTEG
jgi:Icc-related predicted phosphoesterase